MSIFTAEYAESAEKKTKVLNRPGLRASTLTELAYEKGSSKFFLPFSALSAYSAVIIFCYVRAENPGGV
jgi:hypothetical protein